MWLLGHGAIGIGHLFTNPFRHPLRGIPTTSGSELRRIDTADLYGGHACGFCGVPYARELGICPACGAPSQEDRP